MLFPISYIQYENIPIRVPPPHTPHPMPGTPAEVPGGTWGGVVVGGMPYGYIPILHIGYLFINV